MGQIERVTVDGKSYPVVHQFGPSRVLINLDGVYAFVDGFSDGAWELSGEPARESEKPILAALLAPTNDQTTVTVVKDG